MGVICSVCGGGRVGTAERRLSLREQILVLSELLEEAADGFDPAVEVRDMELLVGGMQVVVGEAEAHHHTGYLQNVLESGDDGDRAGGATAHRVFLECIVQ